MFKRRWVPPSVAALPVSATTVLPLPSARGALLKARDLTAGGSSVVVSRKDFKIKNMRTTVIPFAFSTASVDAGVVREPFASPIVSKRLGRVVLNEKDIADPIGVTYPFFVFTTQKEIREKPEVVRRFADGWVQ